MEFNESTNDQGLIQDVDFWAQSNSTNFTTKDKTRSINEWYRRVNSWIWQATGDWEYDDSNYSTLPIAYTDLVADQHDYSLPSTGQKVQRLEVKDNNGDLKVILPFDETQLPNTALDEFYETSGFPKFYRLLGSSLWLYPAPDDGDTVTLSEGLQIYVSREVETFSINATSTEPGFNEDYHRILSIGAAKDYCIAKGKTEQATRLDGEIKRIKKDLQQYYGSRHRNFKTKLRVQNESSI